MVATGTDLYALFYGDVAYKLCEVAMVQARLSWASSSGGRASLHFLIILSGALQEALQFPVRESMIDGPSSLCITEMNSNCNLYSKGI